MRLPAQGPITQGFTSTHLAVDIGGRAYFGTPIVAPHAGIITAAGQMGSGTNDAGLAVDITQQPFKSRLAHNERITVAVGQTVIEGQQIGVQGFTGYTLPDNTIDGTHCHWVLWNNGVRVDGRKYITNNGVEMASKSELIVYYSQAFDIPESKVDMNWVNAYIGHSWAEVLNDIKNDPSYIAHFKAVNAPTDAKVLPPGKYQVN